MGYIDQVKTHVACSNEDHLHYTAVTTLTPQRLKMTVDFSLCLHSHQDQLVTLLYVIIALLCSLG